MKQLIIILQTLLLWCVPATVLLANDITGSVAVEGLDNGIVEGDFLCVTVTITNNGSEVCKGSSTVSFSNGENGDPLLTAGHGEIVILPGESYEWKYEDRVNTSILWHYRASFHPYGGNPIDLGEGDIKFVNSRIGKEDYFDSSNGVIYSYIDDTSCYVYGTDGAYSSHLTIPETVNGHKVVKVGFMAFSGLSTIRTITLPTTITEISGKAFYGSGLSSITIPDAVVSIGCQAFAYCNNLKSVTLPANLEIIRYEAFERSSLLESISLPAKVQKIGSHAFNGCNKLSAISVAPENTVFDSRHDCNAIIHTATNTLMLGCSGSTIPDGVVTIGSSAFGNIAIKTVTIPSSVKTLEFHAFNASGLTSIVIPSTLETIGGGAFAWCKNLKTITLEKINYTYENDIFQNCTALEQVYSLDEDPSPIDGDIFNVTDGGNIAFTTATLYVPIGCKEKYRSIGGWRRFANIEEFDLTGISLPVRNPSTVNVYDIQGRQVIRNTSKTDHLRKGVYIINGRKVVKK